MSIITEGVELPDADERESRGRQFDAAIFPERLEQENAGARVADDCFCSCCGKRGVIGPCGTCAGSGR